MMLPDMSRKVGQSFVAEPGSPLAGPMTPVAMVVAGDAQGEQGAAVTMGGGVATGWTVEGPRDCHHRYLNDPGPKNTYSVG